MMRNRAACSNQIWRRSARNVTNLIKIMTTGKILILNGASSSGKTSLLKAIQELSPEPYLNLGIDQFIFAMPERYLERPLWDDILGIPDQAGATGHQLIASMHQAIYAAASSGMNVIADHVLVEAAWLEECARLFAGLPCWFIGVRCPLEVLEAREKSRRNRTLGQARRQHELVHAHGIYDFEIDTSLFSAEEGARKVLALVQSGQRPQALRSLLLPKCIAGEPDPDGVGLALPKAASAAADPTESQTQVSQAWITRGRKVVLNQPPWLKVEYHTVELPGGRIIPDWSWITTPDYINVVAITPEGLFLVFRQRKYGLEGESLALVGGYLEPGEDPLHTAQRELREETGFTSSDWQVLGHYRVDPNRGIACGDLFLARHAIPAGERIIDDLEEQRLQLMTRAQIESALEAGEFKVLAWAAALGLAFRKLDEEEQHA